MVVCLMIMYIVCDSVGKMCTTNGKTACEVHNYMLLFFFCCCQRSFNSLNPSAWSQWRFCPIHCMGGRKEQHNNRLLNPHQVLLRAPSLPFNMRIYLGKVLPERIKRWNLTQWQQEEQQHKFHSLSLVSEERVVNKTSLPCDSLLIWDLAFSRNCALLYMILSCSCFSSR